MGRLWGTPGGPRCSAVLLAAVVGCAGGESDSIGLGLSAGVPGGGVGDDTTSGGPETASRTDGDPTSDPTQTASTEATDPDGSDTDDPTTAASASGSETGDATTGPVLDCMFAEMCDDGNPCTEDNCLNSVCVNEPVTCDDGIVCTLDACDPATGACSNAPDDAACSDADLCNGAETCQVDLGCVPGTAVTCADADVCTADACVPATGLCEFDTIEACAGGDGCCPIGCSVAADNDCTCSNLALGATASSSGGGSDGTGYGPANWVDGAPESSCNADCTQCFGWIQNGSSPTGAWMQLDFGSDQLVGSMFVDSIAPGGCSGADRAIAGGTVQYWSAGAWVTAATFAGESGDLSFSFDPPFTTSRIRINNVVTPAGGSNSLAFEWYVYQPLGCTP